MLAVCVRLWNRKKCKNEYFILKMYSEKSHLYFLRPKLIENVFSAEYFINIFF